MNGTPARLTPQGCHGSSSESNSSTLHSARMPTSVPATVHVGATSVDGDSGATRTAGPAGVVSST